MAKQLEWTITWGTSKPCEPCAQAKAKSKNIESKKEGPAANATEVNGQIYLDISSIKEKDLKELTLEQIPSQNHWQIMVDELTGKKLSDFYRAKNHMVELTCELFNWLRQKGIPVKILRMDNAGENKSLEDQLKSADLKQAVSKDWIHSKGDTTIQFALNTNLDP